MTQEEKARAYDEALERARKIHKYSSDLAEIKRMEYIFSELHESDDDKIREKLINLVKKSHEQGGYALHKWEADEMLAWLEKQPKQKGVESIKFNNEFENQVSHLIASVLNREHEYNEGFVKYAAQSLLGYAKNELKPTEWSEEDEKNLAQCIEAIDACYKWDSMIDWLKSLRQRNKWKPSEEQMKALHDMNLTGNISYAGQGQALIELYNDLKKL